MEIKVGNAMPMGLARKLSELNIFPVSFSKYGSGYRDMMAEKTSTVTVKSAAPATGKTRTNERLKGVTAYV